MDTKNALVGLIVVVFVLAGGTLLWGFMHKSADSSAVVDTNSPATTTDTVSEPTPVPATPVQSDTAALNERIYDQGVYITPLSVVSDSRCPTNVQCIQAGDVTITAKIEGDGGVRTQTFVTGSPVSFGSKHVTLMSVMPTKNSKTTISPSDYRFTFSVAYGMGGDVPN